ncbi:MAG: alpha/beta hydrolase [Pseudomonadota bacterium]
MSRSTMEFTGVEGNVLAASCYTPQVAGKKPPVVLMHGGGQTRHSWKGGAERLAEQGYLAFTVDARGHGDSAWLKSAQYRFQDYGQDLGAVLAQLREQTGQKPVVIGASLGGLSALYAHQQALEKGWDIPFCALVLVDIVPNMASSGVDRIMGFMADKMSEGFARVEDAADAIAAYLPGRARPKSLDGLSKNLRQREDGRYYWHWDPAFVNGPHNIMTNAEQGYGQLDRAAARIKVPVLLIRGGKSELVTVEAADAFLQTVPHARMADVSEAGHMVAGDKNDVFVDAVSRFLQEVEI